MKHILSLALVLFTAVPALAYNDRCTLTEISTGKVLTDHTAFGDLKSLVGTQGRKYLITEQKGAYVYFTPIHYVVFTRESDDGGKSGMKYIDLFQYDVIVDSVGVEFGVDSKGSAVLEHKIYDQLLLRCIN